MHRLGDRGRDAQRIGRRAHDKIWRPSTHKINVVRRFVVESVLMHISRDADDRGPARLRIQRAEIDAFPYRVVLGPKALRHRFIDDGCVLLFEVVFAERAPGE